MLHRDGARFVLQNSAFRILVAIAPLRGDVMTAENVGPTMDEIRVCACHTNLLIFTFLSPNHSSYINIKQTSSRNSDGVTPAGALNIRWDINISRFSTSKSL